MPSMSQPVCAPCGRVMLCSKTGRYVLEQNTEGEPYKVHHGDEFECPACRARVVVGFGRSPVGEHWQEGFAALLEERQAVRLNPYRRWVDARHGLEPLPKDPDVDDPLPADHAIPDTARWWRETAQALGRVAREAAKERDDYRDQLREAGLLEENPREKGDDDGVEYGHPDEARDDR